MAVGPRKLVRLALAASVALIVVRVGVRAFVDATRPLLRPARATTPVTGSAPALAPAPAR